VHPGIARGPELGRVRPMIAPMILRAAASCSSLIAARCGRTSARVGGLDG
jgi:hypothetical protein